MLPGLYSHQARGQLRFDMTFIVRLLRYVFWVLVLSWVVRLLGRLVSQMGSGAPQSQPYVDVPNDAVSKKLVRDPVCGIHISEGLAVPLKQGSETIFFCSAECRDQYLEGEKKFAANA
jgi:YHS domain-containing protein